MRNAYLEHTNLTVQNNGDLTDLFCRLFDWKRRWEGDSLDNGRSIHVGNEESYLALYTNQNLVGNKDQNHLNINNLNHLGVVVSDIDLVEIKVKKEGYVPYNHGDYEPGRRFYFLVDGLEIEVVSYSDRED